MVVWRLKGSVTSIANRRRFQIWTSSVSKQNTQKCQTTACCTCTYFVNKSGTSDGSECCDWGHETYVRRPPPWGIISGRPFKTWTLVQRKLSARATYLWIAAIKSLLLSTGSLINKCQILNRKSAVNFFKISTTLGIIWTKINVNLCRYHCFFEIQ